LYVYVRTWLALFVLGSVAEVITGYALNGRLPWPPSLPGPLIFASVWTGLAVVQNRYNSPRPR
jgi:cytochrome c oxidase subunit IV